MAIHATTDRVDGGAVIGNVVHFVLDGGVCTAAIVTAVDENDPFTITVRYFPPDGSYYQSNVAYNETTLTDGTWHHVGVN